MIQIRPGTDGRWYAILRGKAVIDADTYPLCCEATLARYKRVPVRKRPHPWEVPEAPPAPEAEPVEPPAPAGPRPIEASGLFKAHERALKAGEYNTVPEVNEATDAELEALPGLGPKSVQTIRKLLARWKAESAGSSPAPTRLT